MRKEGLETLERSVSTNFPVHGWFYQRWLSRSGRSAFGAVTAARTAGAMSPSAPGDGAVSGTAAARLSRRLGKSRMGL